MSTNATHEATTAEQTRIEADPNVPTIRIIRDFDAPPDKVFRAWIDPELVVKWLGPKSNEMRIDEWDARTGGTLSLRSAAGRRRGRRLLRVLPRGAAGRAAGADLYLGRNARWCQLGHHGVRGPRRWPYEDRRAVRSGQFRGS